jgi:hypothetical protein
LAIHKIMILKLADRDVGNGTWWNIFINLKKLGGSQGNVPQNNN